MITRFCLVAFLIGLLISCSKKSNFESFFVALKAEMKEEDVEKLKDLPIDSVPYQFDFFYEEYDRAYRVLLNKDSSIIELFEDLSDEGYKTPHYLILSYKFHSWLNGNAFPLKYYEKVYDQFQISKEREKEELKIKELNLVMENKNSCVVGDTLNLILPIYSNRNRTKTVVLRSYPLSSEILSIEDTLKIKGILEDKTRDSLETEFKLRILSSNESRFYLLGSEFEKDDYLVIPLRFYGWKIK